MWFIRLPPPNGARKDPLENDILKTTENNIAERKLDENLSQITVMLAPLVNKKTNSDIKVVEV